MSTNRQKSFIAELATNMGHLHFPQLTSGGEDASNVLCIDPDKTRASVKFYFRCTNNFYHLYLRTPGNYYGKILGVDNGGRVIATNNNAAATFNLIDAKNRIVTLDDLAADKQTLRIRNTRVIATLSRMNRPGRGYLIHGLGGGVRLDFYLNILERNSAYLDSPDEV
ncbi:hypothetical protein EJ576_17180 [Pseudomonas sp. C 49-2]|uniref:hypothetical protein n=1 Tax=Pseudomonas TaxID=286 RepID=UPI000F05798E|nr:hypothetical protein [Pseudomonas sp. C 49-2]RTX98007.1 hypothetical protein EJ576_17180 [Pseudomonas sp. C 49-2]